MFLKNSKYFKFLYQNHEGHHVLGGVANYNVCCPGAGTHSLTYLLTHLTTYSLTHLTTDHLFGTYVKEAVWRPKMKAVAATRETNKPTLLIPAVVWVSS